MIDSVRRRATGGWAPPILLVPGIAAVVALVVVAQGVAARTSYNIWGGILIIPVVVGALIPLCAAEARRQGDRKIFKYLVIALIVKVVIGSALRYIITANILGASDANFYHKFGTILSERFTDGNFDFSVPSPKSYRPIEILTGFIYAITGPTKYGGFVVFSGVSFLGMFLFYRAFVLAVPEGRTRRYGIWVFLLPSLVFWPSSIGKDAWMMLSIGLSAFGVANVLTGKVPRGLVLAVIGMWLSGIIRPHIAGMIAIGLVFAVLLRRSPSKLRGLGPVVKPALVVLMIAIAGLFVTQATAFLKKNLGTEEGLTGVLEANVKRTELKGNAGSNFSPHVATNPVNIPAATVTVLFRPLIVEVRNVQFLLAAVQNTALLAFVILRWRWIVSAIRSARRQPYVVFVLIYLAVGILGFSSLANFGLLDRQRQQLLPLFLVLLSIPPPHKAYEYQLGSP